MANLSDEQLASNVNASHGSIPIHGVTTGRATFKSQSPRFPTSSPSSQIQMLNTANLSASKYQSMLAGASATNLSDSTR